MSSNRATSSWFAPVVTCSTTSPDYWLRGPGVSPEATRWLYEQGVRVMGIDQWGWDAPLDKQAKEAIERDEAGIFWAAHQIDLPYSQIERMTNLDKLPLSGFTVAVLPAQDQGGKRRSHTGGRRSLIWSRANEQLAPPGGGNRAARTRATTM